METSFKTIRVYFSYLVAIREDTVRLSTVLKALQRFGILYSNRVIEEEVDTRDRERIKNCERRKEGSLRLTWSPSRSLDGETTEPKTTVITRLSEQEIRLLDWFQGFIPSNLTKKVILLSRRLKTLLLPRWHYNSVLYSEVLKKT